MLGTTDGPCVKERKDGKEGTWDRKKVLARGWYVLFGYSGRMGLWWASRGIKRGMFEWRQAIVAVASL